MEERKRERKIERNCEQISNLYLLLEVGVQDNQVIDPFAGKYAPSGADEILGLRLTPELDEAE